MTTVANDSVVTLPEIPDGYTLHKENTTHILLPEDNGAFLNPIQEFNRDLSVACITVWSEEFNSLKEAKWKTNQVKAGRRAAKKQKFSAAGTAEEVKLPVDGEAAQPAQVPQETGANTSTTVEASSTPSPTFPPYRFTLLEALSATGLRSIRYAKEIPLVKYVIANDLSATAVEAIKRNVDLNGLGPKERDAASEASEQSAAGPSSDSGEKGKTSGKVRVNEGDACALMYSHRAPNQRVDCVDLDPYGTAAPFIDAAVQCVNDGGLLCVTCTDLAVLATNNYPEKCFANYGGVPVKAEYCHEVALRLVLHTLSTSAARYGRYIYPLLSLSIDFYVRLFVRVHTSPSEVKKAYSKTATYYVCSSCQASFEQPLGRVVEKPSAKSDNVNLLYRQHQGPPVGDKCPECGSVLHVAGPMWSGPIHDPEFVGKVLEHCEQNEGKYGTSTRMKGMLTVAKEEVHSPFYFTPSRVAGHFHCISPSLEEVASALLHAGHKVSRSHASPGSLKTSAARCDIHDVFRCWIKTHPVKPESISPTSPSHVLHSKEPQLEANFKHHPKSVTQSSKVKLVRYQQNPTPNWGPGTKASSSKRKRNGTDADADDG